MADKKKIRALLGGPDAVMTAGNPSWRDQIADWAASFAGDNRARADYLRDKAGTLADFTPGLGDALGANDVYRDTKAGNYGQAALGASLAAVGAIPGVGDAAAGALRKGGGKIAEALQKVDGTIGDLNNPDVMFEGVSPHDFTPDQWGRFGEAYGVPNLGPKDAAAWQASLKPYTSTSGREFTVPGGIESQEPFTYYDLLHMKQQGINPNDMPPEMHQAIHDRFLTTMSPGGEASPERLFNQFALGQISPNQPLTPNELAVARGMAKGPEDLKRMGNMVPWRHDADPATTGAADVVGHKLDTKTGKNNPISRRDSLSSKIAEALGLGAGSRGGLGARGTADYSRLAETAQRIDQDPNFFRFRGSGELGGAGENDAENWANFVERIANQTPGLSSKTGSFTGVWQNPKAANISAVDRHMAGKFTAEMFPNAEAFDKFKSTALARYAKANPKKDIKDYEKLPQTFRNEQMFGYLNTNPAMTMRGKAPKGSNSGQGPVNANVPEHLQPDNAKWVAEPGKVELISEPYRRVLDANAAEANATGQGIFGSQWMLWDRIRNRLEPHEIMFPGLEKLPRMSMEQMHRARSALSEAGYMSGTKDDAGLQAVRQLPSASEAAYFSHPAATAGGAALGLGGLAATQQSQQPSGDTPPPLTAEELRRLREAQGGFY